MARPWVKLWTKTLLSPDIVELPDYLYRRFIEVLMLAGMNEADGQLQPVKKMAFILRLKETQLSENLTSLSAVGVVHQEADGSWWVTNWKKHQYAESIERVRKYREKEKQKEDSAEPRYGNGYRTVTRVLSSSSSDSNSLSDSDSSSIERLAESLTGLMVMPGDVETPESNNPKLCSSGEIRL